jgi:hypothetical protein
VTVNRIEWDLFAYAPARAGAGAADGARRDGGGGWTLFAAAAALLVGVCIGSWLT